MTAVTTSHIVLDDQGRPWIEGTNTRVTEVIADWLAYGWSPAEIHYQHPHLTLSKIHAAFSYYFDHREELDRMIEKEYAEARSMQRERGPSTFSRRIRAEGRLA